ncbi:hypothetical protein D1AOALGA4SA_1030 [Olavius algarvensis Delta 1 endosymbiont]|nr:hypothetical protein D1AOALGA4SA_1030 [Olavius algarvensis Delta 1 endosymbiont]
MNEKVGSSQNQFTRSQPEAFFNSIFKLIRGFKSAFHCSRAHANLFVWIQKS